MANIEQVKDLANKVEVKTVFDYLQYRKGDIERALPSHLNAERMVSIVTYVVKNNPKLMECTQVSLISAVIQSVQLGLEPNILGHCFFIPYNNKQKDGSYKQEVQFQIGYKGLVELINRSGESVILQGEAVYSNDKFEYEQGLNPKLLHVPAETDRGEFKGAYVVAKIIKANEKVFLYMGKDEIEKVRKSSKAASSDYSPWNTWFDQMAIKTVLKRISKILPMSIEIQKKISLDETTKHDIEVDMSTVKDVTNYEDNEQKALPEGNGFFSAEEIEHGVKK